MAFLHLVVVEQATLLMRWELAHCSKVTAWREAFTDLKDAPAVYLVLLSPRANAAEEEKGHRRKQSFLVVRLHRVSRRRTISLLSKSELHPCFVQQHNYWR
jgi:hypothetical protein